MTTPTKARYHHTDGWRGYEIPMLAVAGASDTGMAADSPAPSRAVTAELAAFKAFLRERGIQCKEVSTQSSNVFMVKRWIVVLDRGDFAKAARLTIAYMADHDGDTQYIHDADLSDLGFSKPKFAALNDDE